MTLSRPTDRDLGFFAAAVVGVLTVVRVWVLFASDLNLHGDESQYWSWSRDLAFGYFSKPPMIAWVIAASTALCGDGDACVRVSAPLFHAGTALVLGILGGRLFDARTGAWTAVVFATLPAVSHSSALVSTDVPLLFFWALALVAFEAVLRTRRTGWAVALGLAVGLGLLSKYAMVYFIVGTVLFAAITRDARWFLTSRQALIAAGLAAACLAPNLAWNIENGWVTLSHTSANAHWTRSLFHPDRGLEFLGTQFGVFGPLMFAALLARLLWLRREPASRAERFLLSFSLPVLAVVVVQAFLSRAHANWAAPAYGAATVLVTAWLLRGVGRTRVLKASVALHAVAWVGLVLVISGTVPSTTLPLKKDPLARLRGWDGFGAEVARLAAARGGLTAILAHDRMLVAQLLRYMPERPQPVTIWAGDPIHHNHYELTRPLTRRLAGRVLYVTEFEERTAVPTYFARVVETGAFAVDVGAGRARHYSYYVMEDGRP